MMEHPEGGVAGVAARDHAAGPPVEPAYVFPTKGGAARRAEETPWGASLASLEGSQAAGSALRTMPLPRFHVHRPSTPDAGSRSADYEASLPKPAQTGGAEVESAAWGTRGGGPPRPPPRPARGAPPDVPARPTGPREAREIEAFQARTETACLRASLLRWYQAMFRRVFGGARAGLQGAARERRDGGAGTSSSGGQGQGEEPMRRRGGHPTRAAKPSSGRGRSRGDDPRSERVADREVHNKHRRSLVSTNQKAYEKVHLVDPIDHNRRGSYRKGSDDEDRNASTVRLHNRSSSQELEVQDVRVNWLLTGNRNTGETEEGFERHKKGKHRAPLPRRESSRRKEIRSIEVAPARHGTSSHRRRSRSNSRKDTYKYASRGHSCCGSRAYERAYSEEDEAPETDFAMPAEKYRDRHLSKKDSATRLLEKGRKSSSHRRHYASRRHQSRSNRSPRSSSVRSTLSSNTTSTTHSKSHSTSSSSSRGRHATSRGRKRPSASARHRSLHQKGRKAGYSSPSSSSCNRDSEAEQEHMKRSAIGRSGAHYSGERLPPDAGSGLGRSSSYRDAKERRRHSRNLAKTKCGLAKSGVRFNSKENSARSMSRKGKNHLENPSGRSRKSSAETFPATTVALEMLYKFLRLLQSDTRESPPLRQYGAPPPLPAESKTQGDRVEIDQGASPRGSATVAHTRSPNGEGANDGKSPLSGSGGRNGQNHSPLANSGGESGPKASQAPPPTAASDASHRDRPLPTPPLPSTDSHGLLPRQLFVGGASHADSGRGRGCGRGASAPPWGRDLRLTRGRRALSCGRLNPYCAVCRAQYNRILVDADRQPLRWPRSREHELNDLFGDCHCHNGYVFGGPGLLPPRPSVHAPDRAGRSSDRGSTWITGSFVPVRLRCRRVYSEPPRWGEIADPPHGKRGGSSTPRPSPSIWPKTLPAGVREDKKNSRDTKRSQQSPIRLSYDGVDTTRDVRDSDNSVETQSEIQRTSKSVAAINRLRRREHRLRHHMKELLSHKPPERRDSQQWVFYMKTLSDGLAALDNLHRRQKSLEVLSI